MAPVSLALEPHASVLALGCPALGEGLRISGPQLPHGSNKNNPRLSGGCWGPRHHLGPGIGGGGGGGRTGAMLLGPRVSGGGPPATPAWDPCEATACPLPRILLVQRG